MLVLLTPSPTGAAPAAVTWPAIRLELVADGFSNPIDVVSPNDGTNRLFVVERGGNIRIIQNGMPLDDKFLDIEDKVRTDCSECGLLGLAFPPDFAQNNYFFINYTSDENLVDADPWDNENNDDQGTGDTVIARVHLSDDPNIADSDSEERILIINQPAANHNGGHILFGPDGYLYIGMGDGGGGGDVFRNAQDPRSLLGKLLRIQAGATGPYSIPADNPFIDTPDYRDEIWAEGLRNPWRFNFDPATGDLYIADVGQDIFEEVNHIPAAEIGNGGMNFGWPIMEGDLCFPPNGPQDCDRTELVVPIVTYPHGSAGGCSITGGHVFHSSKPNQAPVYLYADFCRGKVWATQPDGDEWVTRLLADYTFQITSFGEDGDGNIYLVGYDGAIYRILEAEGPNFDHFNYIPGILKNE
jgi:glucose/arabinose dehydrogenase